METDSIFADVKLISHKNLYLQWKINLAIINLVS